MRPSRPFQWLALLPFLFFSLQAHGTTVLPLDLAEMTRQAGKIFVGRTVGVEPFLDEGGLPSTYLRFRVITGLKGTRNGEGVFVKIYGTEASSRFRIGTDTLLFLYPESSLGFTSPVGAGQGCFENFDTKMIQEIEELLHEIH